MKKNLVKISAVLLLCSNTFAQKSFVTSKDIFSSRVMIENKGQFDRSVISDEKIKYAYETSDEHVYFTEKGLTYKLIKSFPITHEQAERLEKGKNANIKPNIIKYVNMRWLNANKNIQIVESEKQNHYFTFGTAELNSSGFKKITYKNVYNQIDIEYTIPEDKFSGIKYNVVIHPGGNPNDVKMLYSGDVKNVIKKNGEIIVETDLEDIKEHTINSFYENGSKINCEYKLENGIISFLLPNGYDINKTIVIDPFVTTVIAAFPVENIAYEVEYDFLGNLFIYGKFDKVAKYSPSGTLLWVFLGVVPGIGWANDFQSTANFVCNRSTGKIYIGESRKLSGNPARIMRIDANGNYDNWVTPYYNNFKECWTMGYNCFTTDIYMLGGFGTVSSMVDQVNATMIPTSIIGPSGDFQDNAIDDNGEIYTSYTGGGATNRLAKINGAITAAIWTSTTNLAIPYGQTKLFYIAPGLYSQGFNCLAVNNNYLFGYDGSRLSVFSKANGALISTTTIAGYLVKRQGGIAADNCNNVYVGGIGTILCFNFNGTSFTPLTNIPIAAGTPNEYVYDMRLSKANLLYVGGSGFAGTYNAIHSGTCSAVAFAANFNCSGFNNGSAVATLTTNILNPNINYIWSNGGGTVSATLGTTLTSNTVNALPNGIYTVQIQVNAPCGPAYTTTFAINCCPNIILNANVQQSSCMNATNGVSLSPSGQGTLSLISATWSPAPISLTNNSLTGNGLAIGITTINLNYGSGCVFTQTVNMLQAPPPVTFSVVNLTGATTITCINPTINLAVVSNYTYGALSYSWTSPSFTANTTSVSIVQANTIVVTAYDPATGCYAQQTVAIGMNTVVPTNSVNPPNQSITCISGAITFTGSASSPTINLEHNWYSPISPLPGGAPIATSFNTISILSGSLSPGIYTLVTTNLVNGCKAQKTVTITSLDAWPMFSLASTTGFSVGCAPLHQTTLSIINPVSTQTPPATCSYTFLPPSFGGVVTPSIILGGNTSTVTTIPGTWTIIVQDNSNWCRTTISIPIIQNTVAPNVSASLFTPTLTCRNPTVIATGTSTTPNTIISWMIPQNPPLLSTHTVEIGPLTGPNISTTSLTYANYTVIAQNTLNACQTTSVVQIYQNFKPPISSPTISIGTPTAIYCNVSSAPVVLTTGNSTTTSGGGALAFVANPCWAGPSPQIPICGVSSYSAYVAGIYTLTVEDNYNGCVNSKTINVIDKTQPPVLTNEEGIAILDCGSDKATLLAAITGPSTGLMYYYVDYPTGAAFSPTNASLTNVNPILCGTNSPSVTVSLPGYYQYAVTNTLTSCRAYGSFIVKNGTLGADFIPDFYSGYPPLMVTFTNSSASSNGSGSITSVWSFGNGLSRTTTTNINPSTVYNSPGSYTVMLITQKGSCVDTAYKIITVETPSKLETPNIFTPNGDGSNDVFILKTASIGEINATIFDRWGNKIYEVKSSTGNLAWDGKNLNGKECAAGVYFYVINATGKDSKAYEVKGNVSLFR